MSDITARVACVVAALALAAGLATAQESANYRISAGVINAGGSPAGGLFARSGSFRLALSSLGEGVLGVPASSATSRHARGRSSRDTRPWARSANSFSSIV